MKTNTEQPSGGAISSSAVVRCPECEALNGHHPLCNRMDCETAKSELRRYYQCWLEIENKRRQSLVEAEEKVRRFKDHATLWQGKYQIVKHENNVLRRKLRRQTPNAADQARTD